MKLDMNPAEMRSGSSALLHAAATFASPAMSMPPTDAWGSAPLASAFDDLMHRMASVSTAATQQLHALADGISASEHDREALEQDIIERLTAMGGMLGD